MRIAIVAAGFTPGEADRLRRAMATFKRVGTIDSFRHKFIEGMVGCKYPREFAERCFSQIEGFGEYGVRLGMTNPDRVAGRVDTWRRLLSLPRVFSFIHLPLQSGSDEILARMGRGYRASDFLRIVSGHRRYGRDLRCQHHRRH